ncbi:DUF4190 domain-containing protein [Nocardia australiensis]|uniref:DUF4190 domain-containing protein n=1 Tax=Nocardia australiensis TaxID=2887191 RepID=UPI001D13716D|nr:DUF4190 domain-containing protein [Nocardia australiensis]
MSYPPPPPQYGYSPYGYGPPQDHSQATTILILGILGLVFCQILGPFAWVMGRKALNEIDASNGTIGGRSNVMIGYVCGIISSVLIIIGIVVFVAAIVIGVVAGSSSSTY